MRAWLVVVALAVLCAGPTSVFAQECQPGRWLLVTVVEHRVHDRETWDLLGTETDVFVGPKFIDICDIWQVNAVRGNPSRAVLLLRPPADGAIVSEVIEESMQDICAAISTCFDATQD